MDLTLYQLFATTVQRGTVTAAAEALGLSRPTLSRRLSELEAQMGLALLHRSTRAVSPTPAGRRLYEQVSPLLEDLARVEAGLREERDGVSGTLRVSAPPVLAPALTRLLVELQAQHPALSVELLADTRWVELRSDGVEVAVRAGRITDPALIRRRLGSSDVSAVASPRYLARRGAPESLGALSQHRLLLNHGPEGEATRWWPLRDGGKIAVSGGFLCNDQPSILEAALAGAGIGLLSAMSFGPALAEGRLVRVLPDQLGTRLHLHAVLARRTMQPARVTAFVAALVRWFGSDSALDP